MARIRERAGATIAAESTEHVDEWLLRDKHNAAERSARELQLAQQVDRAVKDEPDSDEGGRAGGRVGGRVVEEWRKSGRRVAEECRRSRGRVVEKRAEDWNRTKYQCLMNTWVAEMWRKNGGRRDERAAEEWQKSGRKNGWNTGIAKRHTFFC